MLILAIGSVTWATIAAWATLLLVGGGLYYAAKEVHQANRPFVVVDFEPRSILVFLTVENFGTTIAKDVRFEFKPALTSETAPTIGQADALTSGIPSLAPRKKLRFFFDQYTNRVEANVHAMTYDVTVRYRGPRRWAKYEESYVLDLAHLKETQLSEPTLIDLIKKLDEFKAAAEKWTDEAGGLKIVDRTGDEREALDRRRWRTRFFRARAEKESGPT